MLLRKKIYIGETNKGVVYYNTRTGEILSSEKSKLINTEKAGNYNKYIPLIISLLILFGSLGITAISFGIYNKTILGILVLLWILEFLGMLILVEQALYKHVKIGEITTKKEFLIAANGNLIWNNFGDKKITIGKKIYIWIITSIIGASGFLPILIINIVVHSFGSPIKSEIVMYSLMGIMPAVMVIGIFQNNPIRFIKAVENVRKNK
ncbi:hypothetical protein P7H30_04680 [Streptococcus parauberis]|uniref:hypothetical protein n=1 Tax=Streptococcus parauberis TaxID=1348 RepID=UPI0028911B29|nr:hypothetical protein [Streptococcus parauberis]MDT2749039.1 hypothetical protein [Streptococcus parauberis]